MSNTNSKKRKKERVLPPLWAVLIFCFCSKIFMFFKGVRYNRKGLKKHKKSFILIFNHYSNRDHYMIEAGLNYRRVSFVIASYFFFSKKLAKAVNIYRGIKKNQFKPDISAIRKIRKVIDQKGIIAIAPAGQVSVHGREGYVSPAIVKLLRMCNVDVIVQRSHGASLHWPKWRRSERKCLVNVEYEKVLDKDELANLSDDEIYKKVCDAINVDDYHEQMSLMKPIKGKNLSAGLENLLIRCPKCGAKYSFSSHDDMIECETCHEKFKMNKYGFFEGESLDSNFSNPANWYDWQRTVIKKEFLSNPNYLLKTNVNLYSNMQKEEELELVGCGDVAITHDKVWYEGTINGENVYKEFNYNMLVQLPYGVGTHFEIPTQDYTYKFVPTNNLKVVMEWVQLIDIIREIRENDEHSKSNTEE